MSSQSKSFESSYSTDHQMTVFEGLSVKLTPAPLLKRILAYLIDLSIVIMVIYIVVYIFYFIMLMGTVSFIALPPELHWIRDILIAFGMLILLLLVVSIYDGYFIYFEYKKGTTLGKRVFGLRVVSTHKPKLSLGQCIFRDLFRLIDCTLVLPGLISIAVTKNHQRLGDLVVGTMVTYSKHKEVASQFVYLTAEQYQLFYETLKPQAISDEHRDAFLRFSYAEFISKKNPTLSAEDIAQWENFVHYYVPEAQKHSLDHKTLFLFFAEYCLQSSKKKT